MKTPLLAASLLSAQFACLRDEVREIERAGVDWLHVDVMDGHFVPNLTFGPWIVSALRPLTSLPLDCHLMVSRPEQWIESFAKAGAYRITVHAEATPHLDRLVSQIQELGLPAGVSVNPGTSLSVIEEVLDQVDLVLVMSVNPGFGGQKFIDKSLNKIKKLVKMRGNRKFLIQVDGGISQTNIAEARMAGVDVFVAGSALFGASDRKNAVNQLRQEMEQD